MGYRDESEDALRAKNTQLEAELEATRARIARLEGKADGAEAAELESEHSALIGGPKNIRLERVLPYEIGERGYEAIARLLSKRLGAQASQVGRALTIPNRFSLTVEEGQSRIRVLGDWGQHAGAVIAGPILAGLFAGMPLLGALLDFGDPIHAAWAIPSLVVMGGYGMHRLAKKRAQEQLALHRGVFEAVLALAEEHAIREPPGVRARVELAADAEPEAIEEPVPSAGAGARRGP